MYNEDKKEYFKGLTNQFLNLNTDEIKTLSEISNQIEDLRDVIRFHDHQYYIESEGIITDFEYDQLYKKLVFFEKKFPELASADSPTQKVGKGNRVIEDFPSVPHLAPMLSLDNSYNESDLLDFNRRVTELAGESNFKYTTEPKFDGGSLSLVYENDIFVRGATRGDGVTGEDITQNVKFISFIPLKAAFSKYGIYKVEIRGEVLIRKDEFRKMNEKRLEEGLSILANPRNSASGSLRMKDKEELSRRKLEAVLYHISYATDSQGKDLMGTDLISRYDNIVMLHELGFKTPIEELKIIANIEGVLAYINEWAEKRDAFHYEIDGMVIKVDDITLEERLGSTAHHPRWAMAYKFKARQARTKLLRVDFQVGRVGAITPVAKLEPTPIGGVTVSSISMFNEDFIREKDLRIGDEVIIERAGDVIPYIAYSLKESRNGNEQEVVFPTECPSCNSKLVRENEEVALRCINPLCPAQQLERIIHFTSKDAMDIGGLGPANIQRFHELGFLNSIPEIYSLPFEKLRMLDGLGEKSVTKLESSISESKNRNLYRIIYGLGIRYVGENTAKLLAREITCLDELKSWTPARFNEVEGIGPKVSESLIQFFMSEDNLKLLTELSLAGVKLCEEEDKFKTIGPLTGKSFLFTGTLSMKRNVAETLVENQGGNIATGINQRLNYLVVGADPGSKVEKAKKLKTVEILTEEMFLEMINS